MIKLINLFVIALTFSCAALGKDKILQQCKVDQDCVLFEDSCNEHQSILKDNLPSVSFKVTKNGVLFYTLESSEDLEIA